MHKIGIIAVLQAIVVGEALVGNDGWLDMAFINHIEICAFYNFMTNAGYN
jgi:hypothetical protein